MSGNSGRGSDRGPEFLSYVSYPLPREVPPDEPDNDTTDDEKPEDTT